MLTQYEMNWRRGLKTAALFDEPDGAARVPAGISIHWPEEHVDLSGMTVRQAIALVDELRLAEIARQVKLGSYFSTDKLDTVVDEIVRILHEEQVLATSA